MTEAVEKLKAEVETLTDRERAELAHFLIRLLDQEQHENAEAVWEVELARRVSDIKSGITVGKPAEQVFAELREKYS